MTNCKILSIFADRILHNFFRNALRQLYRKQAEEFELLSRNNTMQGLWLPANLCFGLPFDWMKDVSFHIDNHSGRKYESVFLMAKKRQVSIFARKTILCC